MHTKLHKSKREKRRKDREEKKEIRKSTRESEGSRLEQLKNRILHSRADKAIKKNKFNKATNLLYKIGIDR